MNKKRVVLIENEEYSSDVLNFILEKNGFVYFSLTIEQFLDNLYNCHDDLLMVPVEYVEIIDEKINDNSYFSTQNAIVVTNNDDNMQPNNGYKMKALNIVDNINVLHTWYCDIETIIRKYLN